jgi:hypothetical protein
MYPATRREAALAKLRNRLGQRSGRNHSYGAPRLVLELGVKRNKPVENKEIVDFNESEKR